MTMPASELRFLVLGPVEVAGEGPSSLGGPKQRAVLGMLISRVGRALSNDELIDGIWGESPPGGAESSLRSYVSNLRTAVGADIARSGGGYVLKADPESVDAVRFERLTDDGTKALSANPDAASDTLRAGLALWRGKPYADLLSVEGLQSEIRRLEELRLSAVEARVDADLAVGRHQALVGELTALATEHPLRERLQAQLMVALYRDGRQSEALRAFQRRREYLREELGVDPSPGLVDLELRILNHDPDLLTRRDTVTEYVAFLLTDIAGSTELWETRAPAMRTALTRHDQILADVIDDAGGRLFKHLGDGVLAAFPTVVGAVTAAANAQKRLLEVDWGDLDLRVRMAVDAGEVDSRGGDYFGPPVNRGARVMAAGHGGQILLSELAQQELSAEPGFQLRGLGEQRLKGLGAPVKVFQLVVDGLPSDFPPLRADGSSAGIGRHFGDAIRGYELRERLSAGRISVVYRAFQSTVGRQVAVKVIRPEYSNHPSFVRRFEVEARTVAGLEHPHIVSLYDYWRDPDGAYLVMPLMAGGSLADRKMGALPLERVVGLISQVGSALGYAHRQGVIHRDIKPSNILLDADSNAYLSDFGIAVRGVERAAGIQSDSAIFRAPEDREGGPVDERSDVYSLARVVAGLLTGSASPDLQSLDEPLRRLLESALSEDPGRRTESVDSFVGRLKALNGGMAAAAEPIVARNPYKGLQAFDVADARDFYGREKEIRRLIELVGEHRIVAVIGPSGSGKSSLVRAGLIPALARGALGGSDQWLPVTTVPGSHPFDELASALGRIATESMGDIAAELAADERGLLRVAKRLMRELEGELVIVVDQFEELYTVVASDETRDLFIRNLVLATADARSRVRVVLTLRADFYDRPLADEVLGPIISEANLALAVPGSAQLREAIERPAQSSGVGFEDGLPDRLLTDVHEQPGSLPLLQFALTALVAESVDGRIAMADYERLGGVSGALTRRAENVYQSLGKDERNVTREIFMRLVTVSEETDDARRRVRRSELESLGLEIGAVDQVLTQFGDARLLTFDRDPLTRGPTVEVAHEALLRHWDRFRSWLDARREALILYRRFRLAQAEWRDAGEDRAYLLGGGRLSQFEAWEAGGGVTVTPDERRFLANSITARDAAAARRRGVRRTVMAGFGIAAVLAAVLAVAAVAQRNEAEASATAEAQQRLVARSNELALRAGRELTVDPERAMLLAIEAIHLGRQAGIEPIEATRSLRGALAASRILHRLPGNTEAPFVVASADGSMLATGMDGGIQVFDTESWEVIAEFAQSGGIAAGAGFSPSGDRLAVGFKQAPGGDRPDPVIIYDLAGGAEVRLTGDPLVTPHVQFAGDDFIVARHFDAGSSAAGIGIWSSAGGDPKHVLPGASFDVDPAGERVVINDDESGRFFIVDIATGQVLIETGGSKTYINVSFSLDGTRIAETSQELEALLIRDGATGEILEEWLINRLAGVDWLDGSRAAAGGEGAIRIIEVDTGEVVFELSGHTDPAFSVAAIPGSTTLATAGYDGIVLIWDVSNAGPSEAPIWDSGLADTGHLFSGPGGGVVLTPPGSIWFMPSENSRPSLVIDGLSGGLFAPPSHGGLISFIRLDGTSGIISLPEGDVVYTAPSGMVVRGINDDGSLVVIGEPLNEDRTADQESIVLDTGTGAEIGRIPSAEIYHFSPDSSMLFQSCCGNYALPSLYLLPQMDLLATQDSFFIKITDGGELLALTPVGSDRTGRVWLVDVEALRESKNLESSRVAEIDAHSGIVFLDFSADGGLLATTTFDEPIRIWDIAGVLDGSEPRLIAEIDAGRRVGPPALEFRPDGTRILSKAADGKIRQFVVHSDKLLDIALDRLTRGLTPSECEAFGIEPCRTLEEMRTATGTSSRLVRRFSVVAGAGFAGGRYWD